MDERRVNTFWRFGAGAVLGLVIGVTVGLMIGSNDTQHWQDIATAKTGQAESLTRELKIADDEIESKQRGIEKCFIEAGSIQKGKK